MFTGCNALLPNEIRPAEALPISPRNPRGANVGYQEVATGAVKSPLFGFTFTPVSDAMTIKLGTVTPSGQNSSDIIQVINPETLGMVSQYCYYSDADAKKAAAAAADDAEEEADGDPSFDWDEAYDEAYLKNKAKIGWWVAGKIGQAGYSAANVDVAVGSGFLGASQLRHNIKFTCSGEAPTKSTSISTGAVKSPIFANYLPTKCYLKDILPSGQNSSDIIQVIDPETLGMVSQYCYYSDADAKKAAQAAADDAEEEADGDPSFDWDEAYDEAYLKNQAKIGWWVAGKIGQAGYSAAEVIVKPGDAFLGASQLRHNITYSFKSVLDLTPVVEK